MLTDHSDDPILKLYTKVFEQTISLTYIEDHRIFLEPHDVTLYDNLAMNILAPSNEIAFLDFSSAERLRRRKMPTF